MPDDHDHKVKKLFAYYGQIDRMSRWGFRAWEINFQDPL